MKRGTKTPHYSPTAPAIKHHFKGVCFPNHWAQCYLDDLIDADAPICYGILMPGDNLAGGIPVIKVKDYVRGPIRPDDVQRTSPEIDRQYHRSRVRTGDVLMSIRGGTGDLAVVPPDLDGANITQDTARLRAAATVERDFMLWALRSPFVQRQIDLDTVGQAVTGINIGSVRRLVIPVPPLPEQSKIAAILSTWDEALEKLDALIAAKDHRKQALMQQLLNRSVGHGQNSHARHRLGEVCERVTRRNNSTSDNVLTISAQEGLVSQRDYFNRSVAGADLTTYYLLERGEFAYNRSSAKGYPFGAIKRLDLYDRGVVSTLYLCFRIKSNAPVSSAYLRQYFEAGRLNSGLRSVAKEGARAHGLLNVTADDFFDIDIFLPTLAEQEKIATILDTADQELTLLRRQREALDQQKRGLMQRLLTGKIRTTP